jgi:hypothetical protein
LDFEEKPGALESRDLGGFLWYLLRLKG